jgi:predicted acyl esterase
MWSLFCAKSGEIEKGVILNRDILVPMQDGTLLSVNVFRPMSGEARPTILSVTPYGKDKLPDWLGMILMRIAGVRFGNLDCSRWAGFESPDPIFWVKAGYTVVQADVRGMHRSEGHAGVLTPLDAQDYSCLISWAAAQSWSTGAIGLCGVSYLAMSQWRVAALRPPALRAMIPWEGASDLLREFGYQDGIPETGFTKVWWRFRMQRGWSDQGLHTRGSLIGFEKIASQDKWLYTHGRRKWEMFYCADAREKQRLFFDHFLKGDENGWLGTPRVRLEVRQDRDHFIVRSESEWPIARTKYVPLYLDAKALELRYHSTEGKSSAVYRSDRSGKKGRASFHLRCDREMELTGTMSLKLWIATSKGNDLDLFVVLRKFDASGREVRFFGYNGYAKDCVAKGWLRASHRRLDPFYCRPGRPFHSHTAVELVQPMEIIPVEIEVLASSTLFETGSTLRVDVQGHDASRYPAFRHKRTVNQGDHFIYTGSSFDSHLLAPFVS